MSLTQHINTLFLRRRIKDTKAISELYRALPPSIGRWKAEGNGGEFRTTDGRLIEVSGCQHPDDWMNHQGHARDYINLDEAPHFLELQYTMLIGWNRVRDPLKHPHQRVRTTLTGNPPTDPEGDWIIKRFRPWLDPTHPNPAKPGDLRWFYRNAKDEDTEADGPGPIPNPKRPTSPYRPLSRTFIPAKLEDNPAYRDSDYAAALERFPEPLRSQMRWGDFNIGRLDSDYQLIPSAWVTAAQQRWYTRKAAGFPALEQIGCDPARGGSDEFVIAKRCGRSVTEIEPTPGREVTTGKAGAMLLQAAGAELPGVKTLIDVIGVGSSTIDAARALPGCNAVPIVVSNATNYRDPKIPKIEFLNLRAAIMWNLRLALDPEGGAEETRLALPPDRELMTDLCAPRYFPKLEWRVESKDEIKKRIGRSTDRGDAVALACWKHGPTWAFV